MACIEAKDQVKAAYRNYLITPQFPPDGVPWLIVMGLQVSLRLFGPFSSEELQMRGLHPTSRTMGSEMN